MTPEGKVKQKVKDIIKQYGSHVYSHWPVQNGMGAPTLDCNGAVNGIAFSVETKAPDGKLTERQQDTMAKMMSAGIRVFVIDGRPSQLDEFDTWLHGHVMDAIARGNTLRRR